MNPPDSKQLDSAALVLSGGGVRGAYEVGVVAGIVSVLDHFERSPFQVFAGTSVGAINATFLAANSHLPDLGIDGLRTLWDLRLEEHLRIQPLQLFETPKKVSQKIRTLLGKEVVARGIGRSLLDVRPLEKLVRNGIDYEQLHRNVADNTVAALAIAALEIGSGLTTVFVEHGTNSTFRGSKNPRRIPSSEMITADHVMGSCALPMIYPARKIGQHYYVDGGVRFNTPISPAIRAGADRIVVVAPSSPPANQTPTLSTDHTLEYPSLPFLLGKLLNALLLDPLSYDLDVLNRLNALFDVLNKTLPREVMNEVNQLLRKERGVSYRSIKTLVFRPSQDLSLLAANYVKNEIGSHSLGPFRRWLLGKATRTKVTSGSDLASYLLFDGGFTRRLIELGERDALARADEIRTFFA